MQSSPSSWLVLLLVGKILIYLWQQFPLPDFLAKYKTLNKLHTCDLCGGVHIYALLSAVTRLFLFPAFGLDWYFPVVSEYVTGGVLSFVVHIFSIGWRERFNNYLVV